MNIRIYSCSARQISFKIDQLEFDLKKSPPPTTNVPVTALMERGQIVNRQRKFTLKRWFERIVSNTRMDLFKTKLKKAKYNVHA